jgi:hypothetical protein
MNVDRRIQGKFNPVLIEVNSGVTVEQGDLMFLDSADDLRNDGSSTATNYAYPFEYFRISGSSVTLNKAGVKNYFLGIAMDDVDGINNNIINKITVGTDGKWGLHLKPGKTVSILNMFGASGTTAASNLLNQKVMKVTETTYALGYFSEKKVHALNAEGFIKTAFGGSQIN